MRRLQVRVEDVQLARAHLAVEEGGARDVWGGRRRATEAAASRQAAEADGALSAGRVGADSGAELPTCSLAYMMPLAAPASNCFCIGVVMELVLS